MTQQGNQADRDDRAIDLLASLRNMQQQQSRCDQVHQGGDWGDKVGRHLFGGWARVTYTSHLCTGLSCHNQ